MPTALAILLGSTFDSVIKAIGHDGSDIVQPELPEPDGRRGFHPQELIKAAYDHGFHMVWVEAQPIFFHGGKLMPVKVDHLHRVFDKTRGIVLAIRDGKRHAFAKIDSRIINPTFGKVWSLHDWTIEHYLYMIPGIKT
jgi:hypothetical protein